MTGVSNAVNGPEAAPYIAKAGGTMTGALILNTNLPSTDLQAASKGYVDAVAQGLNIIAACRLATTVALTVTYNNVSAPPSGVGATLTNADVQAALTIDGVAAVVNDRVLVKNQASALQNGVYTVTNIGSGATNWVMTRAVDYDVPAEINPGDFVLINAGTQAATAWIQTAVVTSIGVDSINFSPFGTVVTFPITLSQGGTNANLTASNGGVFYSTATAGAILAGTATARQMFQSGASTTPAWSTATWPATTTANQLLYSSATNTISQITGANSSLLTTNTTGVPSLASMAWTTYTPTVTLFGGAGNTVPVYSTNTGRFCRMGNTVYVLIELGGDGGAEGAGTGQITIALPVQVGASGGGGFIKPNGYFINGATTGITLGYSIGGQTTVTLFYLNTISTSIALTGADQNNTTRQIALSFFYEVAPL
jgi:hypothetical protein